MRRTMILVAGLAAAGLWVGMDDGFAGDEDASASDATASTTATCTNAQAKVEFELNTFCGQWDVQLPAVKTTTWRRGDDAVCLAKPTRGLATYELRPRFRHPRWDGDVITFTLDPKGVVRHNGVLLDVSNPSRGTPTVGLRLVAPTIDRGSPPYEHGVGFNGVDHVGDCDITKMKNDKNTHRVPPGRWPIGAVGQVIGWVDIDEQAKARDVLGPFRPRPFRVKDGKLTLQTTTVKIEKGSTTSQGQVDLAVPPGNWSLRYVKDSSNKGAAETLVLINGLDYRIHQLPKSKSPLRTFFFHLNKTAKADCSISTLAMKVTPNSSATAECPVSKQKR